MKIKNKKPIISNIKILYFIRVSLIAGLFGVPIGQVIFDLSQKIGLSILIACIATGLMLSTTLFSINLDEERETDHSKL